MDFGFDTLDFDKKIILSVSGGRDSTAMSLELWDYVIFHQIDADILLMYENTSFNRSSGTKTVKLLAEKTGWPLEVVKYKGELRPIDILKESFRSIPKAIELSQHIKRKSYKKVFKCCDLLKKQPVQKYISQFSPKGIIIVLGIKGGDNALHRRYRMNQLRLWDTFFRTHKKNGYTYFYPLRDAQESDIEQTLTNYGFQDTKGSGCAMCPIFCIADWDEKDPATAIRSKKYAMLLGVELRAENQPPLRAFCSGVA